jgi:siroheme synthase
VVIHDRLIGHDLLACATQAGLIDVGKRPEYYPIPQDEFNALLVQHAAAGRVAVRLKGGSVRLRPQGRRGAGASGSRHPV